MNFQFIQRDLVRLTRSL